MNKFTEFLLAVVIISLLSLAVASIWRVNTEAKASEISVGECIQLTWHRNMICEFPPGHFTNYTAGGGNIVIVGDLVPDNKSWDRRSYILQGNLVENGSCTMLEVTNAIPCVTPTPSVDCEKP